MANSNVSFAQDVSGTVTNSTLTNEGTMNISSALTLDGASIMNTGTSKPVMNFLGEFIAGNNQSVINIGSGTFNFNGKVTDPNNKMKWIIANGATLNITKQSQQSVLKIDSDDE